MTERPEETKSDTLTYVLVGFPLLLAAAAAWYLSAFVLQGTSIAMDGGPPLLSMASMFSMPDALTVSAFLLAWVVGMVAMMFPAMIPVVSMYSKLMVKGERNPRVAGLAGPPLFLSGYLTAYAVLGLVLFAVVYLAFQFGAELQPPPFYANYGLSGVLLVAGAWQVSPLKARALTQCITPMGFFMTKAKKGLAGAYVMGTEHGWYCVGCCWLYMLVMLAVAAMSMTAMLLLSGLIILEKVFAGGARWFKWASASAFVLLAIMVALSPGLVASI